MKSNMNEKIEMKINMSQNSHMKLGYSLGISFKYV